MEDALEKLNQNQRSAVIHDNGPLLIVAGAGTGKTTVLINRLLYLIKEKKVPADKILLVTFTEKAAGELVERADKLLPYGYVDLWINTFHGLTDRILRDHGLDIGLPADYKILNQTEQWIFIKKHLAEFTLDYYKPLGNPNKFISELIKHFSRLKDENISPAEYLAYAQELKQNQDAMLSGAALKIKAAADLDAQGKLDGDKIWELANAYHTYNRLLLADKFLDFGDLIVYALKLFVERPQILQLYQDKFAYIMVDEFQDTNWSQYALIKLLAAPANNLLAVGDDDQSIFKFRGASLSNIMQFKDDYPEAKEVVLNDNYRSGQLILDRAYEFIGCNNPDRLEVKLGLNKQLKAQSMGGEVKYLLYKDQLSEAKAVVEMIRERHEAGQADWAQLAILIRANATADRFINELKRQGIPSQFVSLRGLYYKPLILDILAYLRLLDNYHESSALFRVLNLEQFKVNHLDLVNLLRSAHSKLWSLFEALSNAQFIPKLSPESQTNINKLLATIKKHTELAKTRDVSRLYVQLVHDIFLPHLQEDTQREEFNYLNQFYKKIVAFEETSPSGLLPDFLELIAWELEAGETGTLKLDFEDVDMVKVMTVHTAKGLEFKYVWLVDAVDKRFPTINRSEVIPLPDELVKERLPAGDAHLAEERRLFYVAMTRAKDGLFITGAEDQGGAALKKPSKFVAEAGITMETVGSAAKLTELERDLSNLDKTPEAIKAVWELPKRFSFSQLETFDRCPWLYKHVYLLKIPLPPRGATVFGRTMHNALRQWLAALINASQSNLFGLAAAPAVDLSWERLKKIYDEAWQDAGFANRAEAEEFRQLGRSALKNVQAQLSGEPLPEILFLEKKFYPRLGDDLLDCTLDRADKLSDGTVEIVDYKTGEAKLKLGFEDKRQLLFYQLALEQLTNLKVSRLTYYYLKTGDRISFVAKEQDLEKIKDWINQTITAIKRFDFAPKPDPHVCRYCDINKMCEFADI
jgi:DNA helicase-2/ATP-dependent DNA helicase PcrA